MKTATYRLRDGSDLRVEYDENAPCINCGEPVVEASMGGTALCPWCDCGKCRFCHQTVCGNAKQHVASCKGVLQAPLEETA